jgi:hypothetical protein
MHVDSSVLPGDSIRAVESVAEAFDARSIRYALIGELAFVLRGRPLRAVAAFTVEALPHESMQHALRASSRCRSWTRIEARSRDSRAEQVGRLQLG